MEAIQMALSVFSPKQKIRLLPFVVTAIFFLIQPYPTESFLGAIFKILPIMSLIAYVILTRSKFPTKTKTINADSLIPEDTYSFCVLAGLSISLIGDLLVIIPYLMYIGGALFMFVHLCYFVAIETSGRHRSGKSTSGWLYGLLFLNMLFCVQGNVDSYCAKIFLFLYFIPLFLVAWKAAAALEENPSDRGVLFGCIASAVFIVSDFIVILDHSGVPIPCAEFLVMVTYYGAQFSWAVSTSNFN